LLINNYIKEKYYKNKYFKKYSKNFQSILSEINTEINSSHKIFNILNKKFYLNFSIKDLKKFKKFKSIVIIGMGGSILGAEAIHDFLAEKIKKKVRFLNNLDESQITKIKKEENVSKLLFIIISKSGNTVETLANSFALNLFKKKHSKNIIIISEKKNNLLFKLCKKMNLFFIEHRPYVGGRYSVLSEVGLLPGYLMGINIYKLRSQIQTFLNKKERYFLKKTTTQMASILASNKFNNLIFINYSSKLEKFLFWCQQLIAESLGKKGKGFLPVISNAPKDHHSLLQLYLDGPKDKIFNIFSVDENSKEKIYFNKTTDVKSFLNKKKIGSIKNAQKKALIKTFKNKNIPFREFKIKDNSEEELGKIFSFFIIETIIIGKMLKINPFDQPAVEQVKIFTKELLS